MLNVRDYGVLPGIESIAEHNANRLNIAMAYARQRGERIFIPEGEFFVSRKTEIPAGCTLTMDGSLVYTTNDAGLVIGETGKTSKQSFRGLAVRKLKTAWVSGQSGITLKNMSGCVVDVLFIEGFATGLRCDAGQYSFLYNRIYPGMIGGCRVGIHLHSSHPGGAPNQNTLLHGSIKLWSSQVSRRATGVLLDAAVGCYSNHNNNLFAMISTELGKENASSVPIDIQCGQLNKFVMTRHESKTDVCVREALGHHNDVEFGWYQGGKHQRPDGNGTVVHHLGSAIIPSE